MRNGHVARRGIASLFMRRKTGWAETGGGHTHTRDRLHRRGQGLGLSARKESLLPRGKRGVNRFLWTFS